MRAILQVDLRETRARALLFLAILLLPGSLFGSGRTEYAFLQYPVEKIRPDARPSATANVTVRCAGNEYESVLIGVSNPTANHLSLSGMTLSRSSSLPLGLTVYRVSCVPVVRPSQWFWPAAGLWPDVLIPIAATSAEDRPDDRQDIAWTFEKSIDVPPGENRTLLLEIYLPAGTRGTGELSVSLSLSDGRVFPLNVRVETWAFDLPRFPSLATAFGFSDDIVVRKHAELSPDAFSPADLVLEYLHVLGRYKISVGYPFEPTSAVKNEDGSLSFDWSGFDALTGRALDGTLFPDSPPATSFQVPASPAGLSSAQMATFYREVAAHARERGWLSRMFAYLPDEPMRSEYPRVREIAAEIKASEPGIRTLVTEPYTPDLAGVVDIWCPDIPFLGDSLAFMPAAARWPYKIYLDWQWNPPPARYLERRAKGEDAWFYTCNSAVFLDYPNLFLDAGAAAHRVIPWLAFRYGFTGLLYWHTVYSYSQAGSPRDSQYVMMANGDGNLLYPGVPGEPDIPTHRPIASLRLQILRDGMEDYEYLALAARTIGLDRARAVGARVADESLNWVHGSAAIQMIREEIGAMIERGSQGGSP